MRIMHLLNFRVQYNGMVHAAIDLACAQVDLGHTVAICSAAGDFEDLLREHNVLVIDLPRPIGGGSAAASLLDVLRAIRAFKPDVVHAHMILAALLAWPVTRLLGVPMVTCIQNSFSRYASLMRIGDRVITGCQAVADMMVERGVPKQSIRPILNGTIGSARQALKTNDVSGSCTIQRPAVITACGLHPRKGIADLIAGYKTAAKSVPDLNLYIFGAGPHEAEYRALAAAEPAGRIFFCGQTPVLRPHLEAADVFVLASLADPAPLVICEAREARLAVVGTRVDGIPELLEYGEAGLLIEPSSPDELGRELVKLFTDVQNLSTWKKNSQIRIDRLNVRRVAEQTVDVYRECVS